MTDQPKEGELILYRTADDAVRVEVLYESETFWLDQRRMADRRRKLLRGRYGPPTRARILRCWRIVGAK